MIPAAILSASSALAGDAGASDGPLTSGDAGVSTYGAREPVILAPVDVAAVNAAPRTPAPLAVGMARDDVFTPAALGAPAAASSPAPTATPKWIVAACIAVLLWLAVRHG